MGFQREFCQKMPKEALKGVTTLGMNMNVFKDT